MTPTRRSLWLLILIVCASAAVPLLRADSRDLRLIEAVKRRDHKAFAALLRAKVDINASQPDGATALAWTIHLDERAMAEALLNAGANVNTTDEYGETPLTLACATGDSVIVQRLLAAGANVDAARWNGETALMIAAGSGSLDAVKMLVLHNAKVNVTEPRGRQTALMWAAAEGHTDVVKALVEMGADVKAASSGGFTALVFSVTKNDIESIRTLLAAGADPNTTLPSGNKPLMVAMAYGHTEAAMALLDGGADISARDRGGNTPLHVAAQQGNLPVVKALLARGADPNARTPKSRAAVGARGGGGFGRGAGAGELTPLMLAARGDHEDVMRALIEGKADPSIRAQDGSNLLMAAAAGARMKTFEYAYELDPHVDVVSTFTDSTIMHVAVALNGRTQPEVCEVIQFLADHGAALDELNGAGRTPIALADTQPVDLAVDLLTKLITERGGKPKIPSKR
jgi:ankyrin repeat protein